MTRFHPLGLIMLAVTIGGMALFAGCGGQDRNEGPETRRFGKQNPKGGRQARVTTGNSEVDALRTLPYVGFSDARHAAAPAGVTVWDRDRAHSGYTLLTTRDLCLSELIDMSGTVVHSWTQQGLIWANTKLLPSGELLVVGDDRPERRERPEKQEGANGAGSGGKLNEPGDATRRKATLSSEGNGYLLRLSWDNSVIWKRSLPVHHDASVLPDGRILVLTSSVRTIPELTADHDCRIDEITLLSPEGEPIESIPLFELFRDAPESYRLRIGEPWFWERWFGADTPLRFQVVSNPMRGGVVDLLHTNTVQPFPAGGVDRTGAIFAPGNVLVTVRHQDLVAIVSLAQKRVLWMWGPGELMGPHDASWLPNGNILIFDNGLGRDWSRVIELDPVSLQVVWEYVGDPVEDFYTATRGANQRLPDGNTLVTESDKGHLFEILPDGTKVWDFWTPHRNKAGQLATITRATRFSEEEIAPLLAPENQ